MDNISLEGFIEFVNAQPAIRVIIHARSWRDCAVGKYASHIDITDDMAIARYFCSAGSLVADKLCELANAHPNRAYSQMIDHLNMSEFNTYGKLQKWIKQNIE